MSRSAAAMSNVVAFRPRGAAAPKPARKTYVRLTDEARARLAQALLALPNPCKLDYERLADQFEVSPRTVQNVKAEAFADQVQRGASGRALHWQLPENTLEVIADYRNCRQAWQALTAEGRYGGTYPTFMRAVNNAHGALTRRRIVAGTGHTSGMGRLVQDRHGFGETYTIDIFALRAPATVNGQLCHPYGALVRESNTATVVAHHLFATDEINASMIASLLGTAFRGQKVSLPDDRVEPEIDIVDLVTTGFDAGDVDADVAAGAQLALGALEPTFMAIGGLPVSIKCDNGSVFIAGDLDAALAGHGVKVMPINSYAKHENGAHERLHRTLRSQLLAQLPGSTDGPRNERGELIDARDPLTLTQIRTLLDLAVETYNSTIDSRGSSPLARWLAADPTGRVMVRPAARSLANLAYIQPGTVQRYTQGLRINNEHYQNPTIHEHPSKRFLVGTWFGDLDRIEVFEATGDNRWLGHATRTSAMTAADRAAVIATNSAQTATVTAAIAAGQQRSVERFAALAPAPEGDSVPDATVHPPVRRPRPKGRRAAVSNSGRRLAAQSGTAERERPGRRSGTIKPPVPAAADGTARVDHLSSDALTSALANLTNADVNITGQDTP